MANLAAAARQPDPALARAIGAYVHGVWDAWSAHHAQAAAWAASAS